MTTPAGCCTTEPFVFGERGIFPDLKTDSRHVALNNDLDERERAAVSEQARAVETAAEVSTSSAARNYNWQAAEWAVAVRGYLGDLDANDMKTWFVAQENALVNFTNRGDSQGHIQRPSYSWWFLMVAYT